MAIRIPRKVGNKKILGSFRGRRSLVCQNFENPRTGVIEPWACFHSLRQSSFILPVTTDKKVIAIKQFRYGAEEVILELPSGNINFEIETPEDAALRELMEETGYRAGRIISTSCGQGIWHDPTYFY